MWDMLEWKIVFYSTQKEEKNLLPLKGLQRLHHGNSASVKENLGSALISPHSMIVSLLAKEMSKGGPV